MTAAFLQSELTTLISDSKRKHADVKLAAEKSLGDLKGIAVTSETQLAGDLLRRPQFVDPFLLACKSQNVKLAGTGAACLQRLIASTAITSSRLLEVLAAYQDAVPLALEVQLKILQTLPSLLQLYASDLHGESLAITLGVSAELSGSKLAVVSSTASATFQQLVASVFERASPERLSSNENGNDHKETSGEDIRDATLVFNDICVLLTGDSPRFVRLNGLSPAMILETIETLLSNHGADIMTRRTSVESCQKYLVPGLARLIEGSTNFGVVARAFRITFILATEDFELLKVELETILFAVLSSLDRSSGIKWKRVLCLEFYRGVCSDFEALRDIFLAYDQSEKARNIVFELMATLVRIASEDPSLIGLGRQSTLPTTEASDDGSDNIGAIDVQSTGTALASVALAGSAATGISAEWSTTPASFLDQVDRTTAPDMPNTYIYTLVLGCVAAFSEGLSKYIMPLSVPAKKQIKADDLDGESETASIEQPRGSGQRFSAGHKYQQLVNPLTRSDIEKHSEIQLSAKMIEDCWPAVLAICSTFLNAALDSYFYHILVRTVQKLTQVSGVLELHTPRDALLTTLAKVSVPINISKLMTHHYGGRSAIRYELGIAKETEITSPSTPAPSTSTESFDLSRQSLNVRNLLCLRALLNLGIALGPTLNGSAWAIILQSLQQVEALMSIGPVPRKPTNASLNQGDGGTISLASEITAVETATRRMIESTKTYINPALEVLVTTIFNMVGDVFPHQVSNTASTLSPIASPNHGPEEARHRATRSVSGNWAKAVTLDVEVQFMLKTIARMSSANIRRFSSLDSATFTWDLITAKLLALQKSQDLNLSLRLQAANTVNSIVLECVKTPVDDDLPAIVIQRYALPCLQTQLEGLPSNVKDPESLSVRSEMMQRLLGVLETLIGQCADLFEDGWIAVFDIISGAIQGLPDRELESYLQLDADMVESFERKTNVAAFRCMQLIISDFLQVLDAPSLGTLASLLASFGSQRSDLNMSLTSTALYWNIVTLLLERISTTDISVLDLSGFKEGKVRTDTRYASLWWSLVTFLSRLCVDERSDVRNAALKMLLKTLEASTQYLTPDSSNICIREVLLPLISSLSESNAKEEDPTNALLLQLIDGTTSWVTANISEIVKSSSFDASWSQVCDAFGKVLAQRQLPSSAAVYSALSSVICALAGLEDLSQRLEKNHIFQPAWMLWLNYHPANIVSETASNELALAAHARVVVDLWHYDPSLTERNCSVTEDNPVFLSAMRTLTVARHTRYSNDVQRLSAEQQNILQNLEILWQILTKHQKRELFGEGLVSFITECCEQGETNALQGYTSGCPNGLQRPTYTALLSRCLELLKSFIVDSAHAEHFTGSISIGSSMDLLSSLCTRARKTSQLPDSPKNPVRRNASRAATELITAAGRRVDWFSSDDVQGLGKPLNEIIASLITADSLETYAPQLTTEMAFTYEAEDINLFHRAHKAAKSILERTPGPADSRQEYVSMLFRSSLVARPWYGDLPVDIAENPLEEMKKIRPGSLRGPELPHRRKVHVEALNALLDLTAQEPRDEAHEARIHGGLAQTAGPYVLLRIAHPLKVFLADQPLRYLTPPHLALQSELQLVLTQALKLRTEASAFQKIPGISQTALSDDGKIHLRLLYPLVLKVKEMWTQLPKLEFCAWQDEQEGKAIEKALNTWGEVLREGWTID